MRQPANRHAAAGARCACRTCRGGCTADACHRLGDHDRAERLVTEELDIARAFGRPRHVGVALRAKAALATHTDARRLLTESVEHLERSQARLEHARTLERLGTLLLEDGDRAEGTRVLARAADLAAQCHATAMSTRLGDPGRPAGVNAFTPAERQVAELASAGLTNRQIAERLYLSEKTVEAHLSRAYRKLGVRSRTQLAVHMAAVDT